MTYSFAQSSLKPKTARSAYAPTKTSSNSRRKPVGPRTSPISMNSKPSPQPEEQNRDDWRAGFDQVRLDQHLAFARLSANEKLKAMEALQEACQDHMPRHEFIEVW